MYLDKQKLCITKIKINNNLRRLEVWISIKIDWVLHANLTIRETNWLGGPDGAWIQIGISDARAVAI
jgi:hypothetical protein